MSRPVLLPLGLALVLLAASGRPLEADILELNDGRLVEGIVVQTEEGYLVRSRFGVSVVPAADVKTRLEAQSIDDQIRAHLDTLAEDDTENRALLARWLVEIGRYDEGRTMAEVVLDADPENAAAHGVLGHIRHRGVWCTPDEAKRSEGFEKHGDEWYTPEEWAAVGNEAREQALQRERRAQAARVTADANQAVRLMLSPDRALRQRGRSRLEALAAELDNPSFAQLAQNVDAYVKKLEEMAEAAALAAADSSASGYVVGEFRATVSKLKRPIQTFETSLGSNLGGAPVRIQLPELEVIRVRTAGAIPVVVR